MTCNFNLIKVDCTNNTCKNELIDEIIKACQRNKKQQAEEQVPDCNR